jgi:hypothetical protein
MSKDQKEIRRRAAASPAWWLTTGLLALIAVGLWVEFSATVARATPQSTGTAGNDSVLVVAGQVTRDTYGLYLVDLEQRTICVYQWMSGSRKLRLLAARTYAFDRELDEYNTEPSPQEIKELVERARRLDPRPSGP